MDVQLLFIKKVYLRKYKKIFKKISAGTANDEFLCAGHHFSQAQNDLIHTQR
jgi:hypothetical protein